MAIIDVHAEIGATPMWGVPFTEAHLARNMQKYGVDISIISSTLAGSCDFVRGNAHVAKVISAAGNLAGLAVVNVNYFEQSQKELHAYLSSDKFSGILLTSGSRDRYVSLDDSDELLNAYRRFVKPVFLYAPNQDALLAANRIAKEFNGMKFVLLGMGGDDWRMATVLADRSLNLMLEVSGSFSPDKIKFAVEHIGSHRLLFGSGLPYTDPSAIIGLVNDADISDADKNNIFSGSAKRLFGSRK